MSVRKGVEPPACADLWWNGWRQRVGEDDVYDGETIRDANGLVVQVCTSEAEANQIIAAHNADELAGVARA